MKFLLLIFLFIESVSLVKAQCYFFNVYDYNTLGNATFSIEEISNSNFIAGGRTYISSGGDAVYILKVDSCGVNHWKKVYELSLGSGGETIMSIWENIDGTITGFGNMYDPSEGASSSFMLKLNSDGDSIYFKVINAGYNDWGYAALPTLDGGLIGAGFFNTIFPPDSTAFILKTDSMGNIEWQQNCGTTNDLRTKTLKSTFDGGYIHSGYAGNVANQSYDLFLQKTDSLGNEEWLKLYGNEKWEGQGYGIPAIDGGYLIVGYREMDFWDSDHRGYIVKTDSDGEIEWERIYGMGSEVTVFDNVVQLNSGDYIISGSKRDHLVPNSKTRGYVARINAAGDIVWERNHIYSDSTHNYIEGLMLTSHGDIAMTGFLIYAGSPKPNDSFILKTDSCGYLNNHSLIADFDFQEHESFIVHFNNHSTDYCTLYWDFGDGSAVSNEQNPVHAYASSGTYTITLIARAGNSTDTLSQTIVVTGVGELPGTSPGVKIFPNPAKEVLFIESVSEGTFILHDLLGREVLIAVVSSGTNKIEIKETKGLHLWRFIGREAGVVAGKVVVE